MDLVRNAEAVACVVTEPETVFAARELSRYLERITGAAVPVAVGAEPSPGAAALVTIGVDAKLPRGAFRVQCGAGSLRISGPGRLEALHAVYLLLETCGGCFWAAPGEEDVPRKATVTVPEMDQTWRPGTPLRGMQLHRYPWTRHEQEDLPMIDWMAKRRMNFALLSSFEIDEERKRKTVAALKERGIEFLLGLHTFSYWLPAAEYFESHPEYYALKDGVRRNPDETPGAQLCMTHPEVVALCAGNIIRYLEKHPGIDIIGLGANDGPGGWCECPACEQLEPLVFSPIQSRLYSTRVKTLTYASFCNRVVEQVAAKFPEQRFAALFYTNTLAPPEQPGFRLHPNLDAVLALFERYYDRPLDAGITERDYRTMLPDKLLEERYTRYPDMLRKWREITPGRVYFHAYFMGTNGSVNLPFPFHDTIVKDFRLFQSLGLDGFYTQGGIPDFGTYGLNFYLAAEASYDPARATEELVDEYCRRFYGPAAGAMGAYYRLLERMACARHNNNNVALLLETFDRETPRLENSLRQAREAAAGAEHGLYGRRVARAATTFHYALLCKRYRLGWLKARALLQKKEMEALAAHLAELQALEVRILDLAESEMLGRGLLHYPDRKAVERAVSGGLRRGACTEKMAGFIDFDIPWDVVCPG